MADELNINLELGPLFTVEVDHNAVKQTLLVGTKSSSLLSVPETAVSATQYLSITTNEAIGLYRAVTIAGLYCTQDATGLGSYAGVSSVAASSGVVLKLITAGLITEGGWTWTPNAPIFIGANGLLTQTPNALPMRRIGWAISGTQINIDPYPTIGA